MFFEGFLPFFAVPTKKTGTQFHPRPCPGIDSAIFNSYGVAPRAAVAFTSPQPKVGSYPAGPRSVAVLSRMDSTWNGVRVGFLPNTSAATPETCGAAIDVPLKKSHEDAAFTSVALAPTCVSSVWPSACDTDTAGIHGVPLLVAVPSVPWKLPGALL